MSNVLDHDHDWTDWEDDKPMNIASQKELIILSTRKCTLSPCKAVQVRIGRVKPATRKGGKGMNKKKPTVYVLNGVDKWVRYDGRKHKNGNFDAVFVTEYDQRLFRQDPDNPYGIIGQAGELINFNPEDISPTKPQSGKEKTNDQ